MRNDFSGVLDRVVFTTVQDVRAEKGAGWTIAVGQAQFLLSGSQGVETSGPRVTSERNCWSSLFTLSSITYSDREAGWEWVASRLGQRPVLCARS